MKSGAISNMEPGAGPIAGPSVGPISIEESGGEKMGEITLKDEFGRAIATVVKSKRYTHNLEIGSWDGTGSTQCFIEGMKNLTESKMLDCLEWNTERFKELSQNVAPYEWVAPYHMSSINRASFVPQSFDQIWTSPFNHLSEGELSFPREMVESWYQEDMSRLTDDVPGFLNSDLRLPQYDAVLIDGSEFMGYSEYLLLKDTTKCFFLDDVFTAYKCNQVYCELLADERWDLIQENEKLRNGYAIFIKK